MLEFLASAGAEVAAEAMKEATTEVVKETAADKMSLLSRKESLADGSFKHDENYLQWKDGIALNEVNPEWIEELTNEISAIYGIENIGVSDYYGIDNLGISPMDKLLVYDPLFLAREGNEHGVDTVIEFLSHEVGHQVFVNTGLFDDLYEFFENPIRKERLEGIFKDIPHPEEPYNYSDYINEACADYIAGLTARLSKVNPEHILSSYEKLDDFCSDGMHPGKSFRAEMFKRGYTRLDRGEESKTLKVFEDFIANTPELTWPYDKMETMRKILEEDVINPILNGELKPV